MVALMAGSIELVQYCEVDGIRSFPDSLLKSIFVKMENEGLVSKAFPEGDVQTAEDFLYCMKSNANRLFLIFRDNKEILGIVWLNGFRARSAYMHHCLFKKVWGKDSPEIGKDVLNKLLSLKDAQGYIFDVLIGMTPANNKLAVKWLEKIGLTILGEIPNAIWDRKSGKSVPGIVSYAQRKDD